MNAALLILAFFLFSYCFKICNFFKVTSFLLLDFNHISILFFSIMVFVF